MRFSRRSEEVNKENQKKQLSFVVLFLSSSFREIRRHRNNDNNFKNEKKIKPQKKKNLENSVWFRNQTKTFKKRKLERDKNQIR